MGDDRGRGGRGGSKQGSGSERGSAPAREPGAEIRTEAKSRLEKLAKAVGNDEIAKRIAKGNATRDQMLAFVTERLQGIRELQGRELALTRRGANFDWWRTASDSHKHAPEPEPTRWHQAASAYERAVEAICRGDLARGQSLMQEAVRIEERTTEEMTRLVDTTEAWRAEAIDASEIAALVALTPASGAAAEPVHIRSLLDAILHVEQTVPEVPNRRRPRDPWWTLEEEEEEEPDGGGS